MRVHSDPLEHEGDHVGDLVELAESRQNQDEVLRESDRLRDQLHDVRDVLVHVELIRRYQIVWVHVNQINLKASQAPNRPLDKVNVRRDIVDRRVKSRVQQVLRIPVQSYREILARESYQSSSTTTLRI